MPLKEKKEVLQGHHVFYQQEVPDGLKLTVTKREHFELTRIRRYKGLSRNFWLALIYESAKHLEDI